MCQREIDPLIVLYVAHTHEPNPSFIFYCYECWAMSYLVTRERQIGPGSDGATLTTCRHECNSVQEALEPAIVREIIVTAQKLL